MVKIEGICRVCISTQHYNDISLGRMKYVSWFIYKHCSPSVYKLESYLSLIGSLGMMQKDIFVL
jgi:hypothetical protein